MKTIKPPAAGRPSGSAVNWLFYNRRAGGLVCVEAALLVVLGWPRNWPEQLMPLVSAGLALLGVLLTIHAVSVFRKRRWNGWFSLLFALAIFFAAQVAAVVPLLFYYGITGGAGSSLDNRLSGSVVLQFAYSFAASGLVLAGLYAYLRWFKISLNQIGLTKPSWSDPFLGLAAYVPYIVFYLLAVALASKLFPGLKVDQAQQLGFNNVVGVFNLVLTFVALVVLPPITEEIMVRGFMFSSARRVLPFIWAAVLTSLLFGAAHLPGGGAAGPLYIAAIDTFILSMVLIGLRRTTGRLYAGMFLHAIKNGIAFVIIFILHKG